MGTTLAEPDASATPLHHVALFYRGAEQYLSDVTRFVQAGVAAGDHVLVTVPTARADQLHSALSDRYPQVTFMDMTELGRNPARILPAVLAFIDKCGGQRARYLSEPIWPGRSADEIREATRHEAIMNRALASAQVATLCAYDRDGLADQVLADARWTHPFLIDGGQQQASPRYHVAPGFPPGTDGPLPEPPADASGTVYERDLRPVRALIAEQAHAAGLSRTRASDFILAASEIAANTLKHTYAGGSVHVWCDGGDILCQIHDSGYIADPLTGYLLPDQDTPGGQGLWVVNQVCDLVEIRSGPAGTGVRLRMRLFGP